MNIYKISQTENRHSDTYDSAVVVANTFEEAAKIFPGGGEIQDWNSSWVKPEETEKVAVEYIGVYEGDSPVGSVILASYNAG